MTLIELLVVIVILTTLVAGVLPILSPNNDARKIREASRGLQTYVTSAQAEAARTGRPHGIVFRETAAGSGIALEVLHLGVPKEFAGFGSNSRVSVEDFRSGYNGTGNPDYLFHPQYNGYPIYRLTFVLAGGSTPDLLPPRMFRIGDKVNVEGNLFLIVDDPDPVVNEVEEYETNRGIYEYLHSTHQVLCIWLNSHGQQAPAGQKRYQIVRQPMPTGEAPYQLPAGVAIDLQGSIVEAGLPPGQATRGFPIPDSLDTPSRGRDTAGILFSPNGSVSAVIHNGSELSSASRVVLLLARGENGGLSYTPTGAAASSVGDVISGDWEVKGGIPDEVEQLQDRVNWLNLDSRWLSIAVRSGRVVVNENSFVDPTMMTTGSGAAYDAREQIEAAHSIAHGMQRSGGG